MVSNKRHKTILFFPLNSPGHINSSLGIADRIKCEYGHRTVFLILGKMIGNCVREHGHELVTLDEVEPYEDWEIEEGEDPSAPVDEELKRRQGKTRRKFEGAYKWPQVLLRHQKLLQMDPIEAFIRSCTIMEKTMVGELMANHANYEKAIEMIAPDMIIIDAYYVPPCVVGLKHIPWVRLYSANPLMLVKSKLPGGLKPAPMVGFKLYNKRERARLRQEEPQRWQAILDEWASAAQRVLEAMGKAGNSLQAFLVQHGCEPLPAGQQAHDSQHLNIYMYPKALDYDQDDDLFEYPARWFRGDSLVRSNRVVGGDGAGGDSLVEKQANLWLDRLSMAARDKEAVVLFSLGSLASGDCKMMQRFVDILKHDERRLYVVSKGVNGDRYELNEGNMIGDNYIPQTLTLEHADLAIVHGGNNSVTECMYYGLPMIVLPVFADQYDNAQRVEDLGYGRRLDVHGCGKEQLLDAVEALLKDRVLVDRMRQIGREMRAANDLAKISLMLNKLLTQKDLTPEFIEECRHKPVESIKF